MSAEEKEKDKNEFYEYAKILVVDDSEFTRKCIINTLDTNGYQVVGEAANVRDMNEILSNQEVNLFIIDVVMPETSGIELTQLLKEKYQDIYIIMISSLNSEQIILESIGAGANDFLVKPMGEDTLISSVRKMAELIKEDQSL